MDKHYIPTSTKIIGVNPAGEPIILMFIDEVEEYVPDGSYHNFIRVLICNEQEGSRDSFLFDTENNYKLTRNYIESSESSMELLTLYMMLVQQNKIDLNGFVMETARKMKADFGYKNLRMVDNKKGA